MALSYAFGKIQWQSADAATTTYTVSGLSFQPKALRFITSGIASSTDAISDTDHIRKGIGFATSTSDRKCVAAQSQDNTANATCTTAYRNDCVAMTVTSTPAVDGLLDLNSITSDGFTLIVDDQSPVNITVFWEAWGGSDITVAVTGEISEPAATGNVDYTVTGFTSGATDQVVLFGGVQFTGAANATATRADSGLCLGVASGTAAGENWVMAGQSDDGSANMDCDSYALDGECIALFTTAGGNPNARATLTTWGANNFRLNWIARGTTARKYIFLAIKGGQWRAGGFTIDTATTNATATVSSLPFQPIGLALATKVDIEATAGTSVTYDLGFIGMGTSTTSRQSMGWFDTNGAATSATGHKVEYDQVLCATWSGGPLYDIDAINSDGFRIIVDVADAAEPATTWIGYLTFASAAVVEVLPRPPLIIRDATRRSFSW